MCAYRWSWSRIKICPHSPEPHRYEIAGAHYSPPVRYPQRRRVPRAPGPIRRRQPKFSKANYYINWSSGNSESARSASPRSPFCIRVSFYALHEQCQSTVESRRELKHRISTANANTLLLFSLLKFFHLFIYFLLKKQIFRFRAEESSLLYLY